MPTDKSKPKETLPTIFGDKRGRAKDARRLHGKSLELAKARVSAGDGTIPIAILPNSDVYSLVDVVGILVRAQNPALSVEPEAKRTAEWERQARSIRNDVMSAAESGTLRVCLRDKCLAKGFDKNAVQNYIVKPDDLQHWLDSRGVKWQQASPPGQIAVPGKSSPTSTIKSAEGNPVDASPVTSETQELLVDAKMKPAEIQSDGKSKRLDALALELDEMLKKMRAGGKRTSATAVFAKLKEGAGKGGCVVDVAGDGTVLMWERPSGKSARIAVGAIQKRIDRWKETNPA